MRKSHLFILLLLGFALSFSDAGHAAIREREIPGGLQKEYVSAEVSLPHTEIEVLASQHTGISHISHGVKKVHAVNGITIRVPVLCLPLFSYSDLTASCFYSKNYLDHIYPSHNFW